MTKDVKVKWQTENELEIQKLKEEKSLGRGGTRYEITGKESQIKITG